MAAVMCSVRVVAGGDEDSDSDDGDWDIGVVRQEPQQLDEMLQADKNEALKKALFRGDASLIEELLNSGISIETSFQFGWTPLMCAASVANFAVVRLLLDRGANACFEIDKYTVLMAACTAQASEENILNTVELLLSRNADPNLACRKQMTALMYAARKGYPRVVAFLVAHGSHINAQDENGYTALIWAVQHGHKSVILKLLELGADKNLQTKDEKTAADLAKINKHLEIFNLLSLAANHLQGRYHKTVEQEANCKFLTAVSDHSVGSYSTFHEMEVFLHGLGLEHIRELLQEQDIALRQLLTMQKDDLIQMALPWAPTECYIEVCKDVICSVKKLEEEVHKLKDLVVEYEEKNEPNQVKVPEKAATLEKRSVKMGVVTLLGFGFFLCVIKLVAKRA
ncbi:ankyrin repeat, SAM and basic leucine zipper domain-containing protein 1 isoform X3 [Zonotrichia albicollis]|uniref:ankyrin repeat, SAM and basic leucine zipper domain-containing protein 1 isoform X3 n=1 Tax=Zonotrichia albicollis TaxID=44394 RepID=UPI000EAAEC92|nr:ankyrin repeat, SAM and basic leucine zipper domain-containing protein 1 isoform X3 [Zonotrichia albicollis]